MDDSTINDFFCLGAGNVMDTVNFDRMPAGCEYLGNLGIPNLLSAYTGQK